MKYRAEDDDALAACAVILEEGGRRDQRAVLEHTPRGRTGVTLHVRSCPGHRAFADAAGPSAMGA